MQLYRTSLVVTAMIATTGSAVALFNAGSDDGDQPRRVQEDGMPAIPPASEPDTSDPFSNYVDEEPQSNSESDGANEMPGKNELRNSNSVAKTPMPQESFPPAQSNSLMPRSTQPPRFTPPASQLPAATPAQSIPLRAKPPQQAGRLNQGLENGLQNSNPNADPFAKRNQAAGFNQPSGRLLPSVQTTDQGRVDSGRRSPPQDMMVDPNLQPATYNSPLSNAPNNGAAMSSPPATEAPLPRKANAPAPRQLAPNIVLAQGLLAELSNAESDSASVGQPTQLLDLLANCDMNRRKQMIQQYWKTYAAWAEYRFAIDELQWIQRVGQARSSSDQSMLEAARSAANDSIAARALELSQQQNRLNQLMNGPRSATLPLPSDTPLVTRYRTNFDLYAARRSMPEQLRVISEWLPEQQQLIGDRAATVQRCRNAVSQATTAVAQGQPVPSMLQTIELCRDCHSRFIKSVVAYNQRIAEYALTIKPNHAGAEQVVAMLIPAPSNPTDSNPFQNQTRQATLQGTPYQGSNQAGSNNQRGSTLPPMRTPGGQRGLPVRNNGNAGGGFGGGGLPGQTPAASSPASTPPSIGSREAFNGGGYRPPAAPQNNSSDFRR